MSAILTGLAPIFGLVTAAIQKEQSKSKIAAKDLDRLVDDFDDAEGIKSKEIKKLERKLRKAKDDSTVARINKRLTDIDEEWGVIRGSYLKLIADVKE